MSMIGIPKGQSRSGYCSKEEILAKNKALRRRIHQGMMLCPKSIQPGPVQTTADAQARARACTTKSKPEFSDQQGLRLHLDRIPHSCACESPEAGYLEEPKQWQMASIQLLCICLLA